MLPSQDHKRHKDGDVGANTGGMGAYCPCPLISESELAVVRDKVLQKAVDGLKMEGIPFTGKTLKLRRVALFTFLPEHCNLL
jgi:phosphoribosylamine--glycine ligase/phosphoribosylglycinamide formyltransferase/phosphoribosylformylglycinamidine cyclo-ligase